jgi:Protein of unknown function (DUF2835)
MKRYEFHLDISAERYLDYYRGMVQQALVRSTSGETVRFPASMLKAFVTPAGIHGDFVLTCDDEHRGAQLRRLGP